MMRGLMRAPILILCVLLICLPGAARAQGQVTAGPGSPGVPAPPGGAASATAATGALKVFLDCKNTPCYHDYVKTEIAFVDYVTIRESADVHVLVTSLHTGAGGREFAFKFIGQGPFQGVNDEVLFATLPTDTEELSRRSFVRTLKLGLVRYALHSGLGHELSVTHRPGETSQSVAPGSRSGRDPWNYWVLRARVNGSAETEASSKSHSYFGSFSANRTTAAWKLNLWASRDYRKNKYTFSDGETYTGIRESYDVSGLVIKSLTAHWSAGARAYVSRSTYENKDRVLNGAAAVEYSVFPYADSTRRQLTFQYLAGIYAYDYVDETVYGKLRETVGSHTLRASFDLKQTWGSLSADMDYSAYLHDASKNRKSASVEADVRLFKGLALNIYARTSGIHDQLYLPKGDATDEEVLARQRQLATSFRHSLRIGISYTFGSIFSNVVNTRLSNLD